MSASVSPIMHQQHDHHDAATAVPDKAKQFVVKQDEAKQRLLTKHPFASNLRSHFANLSSTLSSACCRRCTKKKQHGRDADELPGSLSSLDELQFNTATKWLDGVGEPDVKQDEYDATKYPKSIWGAITTTLLRLLVLLLIVWYLIQLFSLKTLISQGSTMQLNPPLPSQKGQQVDVPTLEFQLNSKLSFYESESPSLQRIDVQDMTGYNPTLVSKVSKVPLATAFYASTTIDLNSFDNNMQTVQAAASSTVQLNMRDRSYAVSTHSFAETIKVLYEDALVYPTDNGFFNHTAIVYARIPQTALRAIKPCQAQLLLYNKAVYNGLSQGYVLNDRSYQSPQLFPGLVSTDELWRPSLFGSSGSRQNRIELSNNSRMLLKLSSRMTSDMMTKFATNQSWGSQSANLSEFYNISDTRSSNSDSGIMTQLDFLNWELGFSYVNNMQYTFTNISCDGDETSFDLLYAQSNTTISATATTITIDSYRLGSDEWQSFDPDYLPASIVVIGAMGQEEMIVTAVTDNNILTVTRSTDSPPIDFTWNGPAFTCDTTVFPTSVADLDTAWTCDTAKYWANDGCDCNCGAYDPDCCLMIGGSVENCVDSQTCSPSGQCVNAFVSDPNTLLISESCYAVNYPGDVTTAGYVGTDEQFAAAGGDQCLPCPGDQALYGGQAQLDSDTSTYVCNVAAVGTLSGEDNFQNPPASSGAAVVQWDIQAHSAPFPTMGFPYPIEVGDGTLTEILYVYNASSTSTTTTQQTLSVGTASRTTAFKYGSHIAMGKLVSAMNSNSDLLVVIQHPLDTTGHPFSIQGPYDIRAAEQALVVNAASIAVNKPYQVLRTQTVPSQPMGYSSYLQQTAYAGDTVLRVAPFGFWWDSQVGTAETGYQPYPYPSTVPMLVRGSQDYTGLELIHSVSTVSLPTWLCDPSYFHAGDGCDCNCGLWDPDCGVAGATIYDSSVDCTRNATCASTVAVTCPYCAWTNTTTTTPYPTGTCSTTDPNNPTPIPTTLDSQTYYQLINLSTPLLLDHITGTSAETPVPLTTPPNADWYNDSSTVYDVFTYATVALSRTAEEYTPDDRYDSHPPETSVSPDTIPIEFAMYIIPDRPTYNNTTLCPNTTIPNTVPPAFTSYGWDKWSVAAGRQLSVSGCIGGAPSAELLDSCVTVASQEALQDFNLHCITEMAPSYLFDFNVTMPINNKWQYKANNSVNGNGGTNLPEYEFDFQVVYHFSRDNTFLKAEQQFAQNQPNGGDHLRSDGSTYTFYGQRDEATTDTQSGASSELPATSPYANVRMVLQPSTLFAVADLHSLKPTSWPSDTHSLQKLVDSFPTLSLTWDLDVVDGSTTLQQLPLLPGYAYFLTADISIATKYKTDILGRVVIDSWTVESTSGTPSVVALDYFQRQQSVIRYKLNFESDEHQLVETYAVNLSLFIGNVGGALNYLAQAALIVGIVHRLLKWNERQDLYKKAAEERSSGSRSSGESCKSAVEELGGSGSKGSVVLSERSDGMVASGEPVPSVADSHKQESGLASTEAWAKARKASTTTSS